MQNVAVANGAGGSRLIVAEIAGVNASTGETQFNIGAWRKTPTEVVEIIPGSGTFPGISDASSNSYAPVIAEDRAGNLLVMWGQQTRIDAYGDVLYAPVFKRYLNGSSSDVPCPGGAESAAAMTASVTQDFSTYFAWSRYEGDATVWKWDGLNCVSLTGVGSGWRTGDLVTHLATTESGDLVASGSRQQAGDVQTLFVATYSAAVWTDISPELPNVAHVTQSQTVPLKNGDLAAFFVDVGVGNRDVFTMLRTNSVWSPMGSPDGNLSRSTQPSTFLTSAPDANGAPLVAWREGESGISTLQIRRWSGSQWDAVGDSPDGSFIKTPPNPIFLRLFPPKSGDSTALLFLSAGLRRFEYCVF